VAMSAALITSRKCPPLSEPGANVRWQHAPVRESSCSKFLTQNQMLAAVHSAGRSPRTRSALTYINWYINGYGRPWTSSDPNPTMRPTTDKLQVVAGCCL
jgi:hypothetical protein